MIVRLFVRTLPTLHVRSEPNLAYSIPLSISSHRSFLSEAFVNLLCLQLITFQSMKLQICASFCAQRATGLQPNNKQLYYSLKSR